MNTLIVIIMIALWGLYMYVMGLLTRIGLDGIFSGRKRKKELVTCVKCIYYIEDKSILGFPQCKINRKTRFTTNQMYFGFCSDKNWNGECKDYKSTEGNNGQKTMSNGQLKKREINEN